MSQDSRYSLNNTAGFISDNFGVIFLAVLFFVGGFFVGSLWTENKLMRNKQAPVAEAKAGEAIQPPTEDPKKNLSEMPEISESDHIKGVENPQIYLVEYSDYECPYCSRFHPTMEKVLTEYGDQIAIVYRHYPLSFHSNAQSAAETAECVAKAGGNDAFWEYTDAIFAENTKLGGKLNQEAIDASIKASGANAASVAECVKSGEMTEVVTQQMNGGSKAGISGTPGTIIVTQDGQRDLISGALPYEQVQQVLEQYL